tara:strand:- start:2615 stop:3223 length:609 start_codon:yes stop_codon:yes gene_type:complete
MRAYRYLQRFIILYYLVAQQLAAQSYDLTSIMRNIGYQIDPIKNFLIVLSYVIGVGMCVVAIMKLKKYGTRTAFMHVEMTLLGPFLQFFIGVGLFYFPVFIDTLNVTVWSTPSVADITLGYENDADSLTIYIDTVLGVIQVIGMISFIRGWVQISKATNAGNQPGVVSKALTYIIGGLMALNIKVVICTFYSSLLGASACAY